MESEELYDKNGYPICPGDVLKVFHFVAALRRERRYMYKLVIERDGYLYGVSPGEIVKKGLERAHSYRLKWNAETDRLDDTEIVEGYGPGDIVCHRDRPRKKRD